MTDERRGDRLFRAWAESTEAPDFDEEAGRARFLEAVAAPRPRARARGMWLAAAALLCVAALVWWRTPSTLRFTTDAGEGHEGAWLATSSATELPLTFSEGTRVVIEPDSRGRVKELGRAGASFVLERGEVRAKVVHRAATSWRFLAGPFDVQVTGTALRVAWDPARERFAVAVDEGAVTLRGPHVGGAQVVRAGERCEVDLPSRSMRLSPNEPDGGVGEPDAGPARPADADVTPPAPSSVTTATRAPPPPASWTILEAKGDYDGAYAAAAGAGLAGVMRASSADELLRLAQVGQLSGHRDTEREALLACRRRFPGREQAAVAAYELGRASSQREAATWFDTYLREAPSGPLAREALGRLVEARTAAGDRAAARDAATLYLSRYPGGPHAALARRVLASSPE
jgi:FecR protein